MDNPNSNKIKQEKSVSALDKLVLEEKTTPRDKELDQQGLGVSLQNFDSLMDHLASMNIKFLN